MRECENVMMRSDRMTPLSLISDFLVIKLSSV